VLILLANPEGETGRAAGTMESSNCESATARIRRCAPLDALGITQVI
jgi:hypothetical protein